MFLVKKLIYFRLKSIPILCFIFYIIDDIVINYFHIWKKIRRSVS